MKHGFKVGKIYCQFSYLGNGLTHPAREVYEKVENAAQLCRCPLQLDTPHWHDVYEDGWIDWEKMELDR